MYLTLSLHPDPFTKLETVFDELGRGFTPFYHLDVNSKVDQLTLIGQDTALRVAITSGTFTAGHVTAVLPGATQLPNIIDIRQFGGFFFHCPDEVGSYATFKALVSGLGRPNAVLMRSPVTGQMVYKVCALYGTDVVNATISSESISVGVILADFPNAADVGYQHAWDEQGE